jgi:phytoene synthase
MEEGWAELLSPDPLTAEALAVYARKRGGVLFALSARLLGGGDVSGGEAWALADLARHSADPAEREAALAAVRSSNFGSVPTHLRPLGMLAVLARRDAARGTSAVEPQASPARMWRMLKHRLTGL